MGDIDYGLRATSVGFSVFVMPGFAGTCHSNPVSGTFADPTLPLAGRWKLIMSPTGRPPRQWLIFLWRHRRLVGLCYWISTYAKVLLNWSPTKSEGLPNAGE